MVDTKSLRRDRLAAVADETVRCESAFTIAAASIHQVVYRIEQSRGYAYEGDLWSPGFFHVDLREHNTATLVGSTEKWEIVDVLTPEAGARGGARAARALAGRGDSRSAPRLCGRAGFCRRSIRHHAGWPIGRSRARARRGRRSAHRHRRLPLVHRLGPRHHDQPRRLDPRTGRWLEAGYILRTFAHYVRDGLIPNMFPDGAKEGLYHTADATLWFFHALNRYLRNTDDRTTLNLLLPTLIDIVEASSARHEVQYSCRSRRRFARAGRGRLSTHLDGREDGRLGGHAASRKGGRDQCALVQRASACSRIGCARMGDELRRSVTTTRQNARAFHSINASGSRKAVIFTMWSIATARTERPILPAGQIRSLPSRSIIRCSIKTRWTSVVDVVEKKLVTPVGLRSLSPDDPEYKPIYSGDLRSRDGAYHQGTVWAWLIGPFIDAWLKVHPEDKTRRTKISRNLSQHLSDNGIGTISEVFDAREPHIAGGCIAQAWSVAEVLRSWIKTA